MAQSHRTASLNRLSGLPVNNLQSHRQPHQSFRAVTARHVINPVKKTRNLVSQQEVYEVEDTRLKTPTLSNQRPMMARCVTPISMHASEAHIHRIRSAASLAEFKQQYKVASSLTHVPTSCRKSKCEQSESEDENADIESVDWSSPLDITSYLYKPEFVINPKQDCKNRFYNLTNSIASTEKDVDKDLTTAKKSEELNSLNDAIECLDRKATIKADIIADYIKSSKTRKETDTVEFDRKVFDCVQFIKHVNNDIRDMKTETKRLEELHSPRVKHWMRESRDEIISRGYTILKRIYELNSELTEAAAKKHITGPPGNHWMGLSRVEVIEIMQKIHKEFGVPRNKHSPVYLQYDMSSKRSLQNGRLRRNSKKGKGKKRASKNQLPRDPKTPKVRPPQMMPVHVPGPPHLHTNICIRPWEPQQDGWSQQDDTSDLEEMCNLRRCSSLKSIPDDNNYYTTESSSKAPPPPTSISSMYSPPSSPEMDECAQSKEWAGEDYVTLEIFNPVFRISR